MTEKLEESLWSDLARMKRSGMLKTFQHVSSPMSAEVAVVERGERILVLSSNNYLGLSDHPHVIAAGKAALDKFGAGTASVRFICGTLSIHREIEVALAELSRSESALTYVSCWAANTGILPAIAGEEDAILSDELNHASLIDGCRASKAARYVYRHSDMSDLRRKLEHVAKSRRVFIITDGVFSMEGDLAKLPDIVALARDFGASVLVDDSHGTGVMGSSGRGTAEFFGVEGEIDIITGTLGKALGGAAGGYVAGSRTLIAYLSQVSRPQLFSNALPATVAGSALKAVEILRQQPERVSRLHENTRRLRYGLKSMGFGAIDGSSAILPIIVGDTSLAVRVSQELLSEGIFVTGFGYPVVPEGTARLRIQGSASLTGEQIELALRILEKVGSRVGMIQ